MPYAANGIVSMEPIPGGIPITDSQYRAAIVAMSEGKVVSINGGFRFVTPPKPEPAPEPAPVPVVSAAQGGIALIQAGLMEAVIAAVEDEDTPAEVKWAWARATEWRRDSPALHYLAEKAGITEQMMDELFEAAKNIQV